MSEEKFVWVMSSQVPNDGPRLIQGQTYEVKNYGEAVVSQWVNTGAAQYCDPVLTVIKKTARKQEE